MSALQEDQEDEHMAESIYKSLQSMRISRKYETFLCSNFSK